MRILLTGRNGQVGWEAERALSCMGKVVAFDRQTLDLAHPEQIVARVRDVKPDIIVNAAAYTAVDMAENDPELAMKINGTAPGVLAAEANRLGALLVHYSTDYVFDGTKGAAYTEEDVPNPLNVYGKSKLAGEKAITASGCRHIILRTSWVYSSRGKNFLLTVLRLAREKPELRIVDDQWGAPTWARQIADATADILRRNEIPDGVYHLSAAGETTWCRFARKILELSKLATPVHPIATADYPAVAQRPAFSVLDNSKLTTRLGIQLPDWSIGLRRYFAGTSVELRGRVAGA